MYDISIEHSSLPRSLVAILKNTHWLRIRSAGCSCLGPPLATTQSPWFRKISAMTCGMAQDPTATLTSWIDIYEWVVCNHFSHGDIDWPILFDLAPNFVIFIVKMSTGRILVVRLFLGDCDVAFQNWPSIVPATLTESSSANPTEVVGLQLVIMFVM